MKAIWLTEHNNGGIQVERTSEDVITIYCIPYDPDDETIKIYLTLPKFKELFSKMINAFPIDFANSYQKELFQEAQELYDAQL